MASRTSCLILLILAVNSAYGLTCYKCDSSESTSCKYGLFSVFYNTIDCSQESGSLLDTVTSWVPKQCVKIVATSKSGKEYIARGCVPHIGDVACNSIVKATGFFSNLANTEDPVQDMKCSVCDGDKCNSASKFTAVSITALALAFILRFL